jgi:hypothetical protein
MDTIRRTIDRSMGNRSGSGDHITYEYGNDLTNIHFTAVEGEQKKHVGIFGNR